MVGSGTGSKPDHYLCIKNLNSEGVLKYFVSLVKTLKCYLMISEVKMTKTPFGQMSLERQAYLVSRHAVHCYYKDVLEFLVVGTECLKKELFNVGQDNKNGKMLT